MVELRVETEEKCIANKRAGRETQEWQGEEKNSEKKKIRMRSKDKAMGKDLQETIDID
jgi:hypothetical protein